MRIVYRASQFWDALQAVPGQEQLAKAESILSRPLMELFRKMLPSEQAHSLRVYQRLVDRGETSPDLLKAALLHDAGKVRCPLYPWERAMVVLGKTLFPNTARRWGQGEPLGWKRAFVTAEMHPYWGAEMAAQAGASAMTATLIKYHQSNPNELQKLNHLCDSFPAEHQDTFKQLLTHLQTVDDNS